MQNSLIDNYLARLKSLNLKEKNQQIGLLISELDKKTITSIKELQTLIAKHMNPDRSPTPPRHKFFSLVVEVCSLKKQPSESFYKLLETWKQDLVLQLELNDSLLQKIKFQSLSITEKSSVVLLFIQQLLQCPNSHLHIKMRSLLGHLEAENLVNALNKLATLADAPLPLNLRKGDFRMDEPGSAEYQQCQQLLSNNSLAYDEKDEDWVLTNSLLQDALLIYKDIREDRVLASENEECYQRSYGT